MMQNVLILSSRTGGGHQSAAMALENSFLQLDPDRVWVKIAQVLEEATATTRWMADLYNYLLREHQDWMKYYYWAINKLRPNESKLILKAAFGYGAELFNRYCPSVIVSVHPMTQHFCAYMLRKLRLLDRIPLVTVVTDPCYGFWKGWACSDVKTYYVATPDAKQQLLDYGIASHRIHVVGMPVHSRFQPVSLEAKRDLRLELGLDPNKLTVFLNAGWAGGGNVFKIYQALMQAAQSNAFQADTGLESLGLQVIFLGGQNSRLLDEAAQLSASLSLQSAMPIHLSAYTPHMERLMHASDVMVTKMGGLTTFEALNCHLPILADAVTPPMPQEAQTAQFIEQSGVGQLLYRPDDIVSVLQSFLNSPEQYQQMKQATQRHGTPGAAEQIAGQIAQETLFRSPSGFHVSAQAERQLTSSWAY